MDKKYKFVLHYSNFLDSWKKRKIEAKKNQIIIFDNKFIIKNTHKYLKFLNKFFEFGFSKRQMQVAVEQLDIKRISKMTSSKSIRITKKKISFSKDIEEFIVKNCKEKYLDILNLADNNKIKN